MPDVVSTLLRGREADMPTVAQNNYSIVLHHMKHGPRDEAAAQGHKLKVSKKHHSDEWREWTCVHCGAWVRSYVFDQPMPTEEGVKSYFNSNLIRDGKRVSTTYVFGTIHNPCSKGD